jgi:hypothetical protein
MTLYPRVRRLSGIGATFLCSLMLFPMTLHAQTLLGPSVYTSFTNSPFSGGAFSYFHLETMEDGLFNVPGVTASAGSILNPGSNTDSVDADDGVLDGLGRNGRSFFLNNGITGIRFTFSALTLGELPTHVGIVWTDGSNTIRFEAFDALNNSLGFLSGSHADGSNGGLTGEDRFYGMISPGGIGSMLIQSGLPGSGGGIEVDHLQYGLAVVPEPGTLILTSCLMLSGVLTIQLIRRKGH